MNEPVCDEIEQMGRQAMERELANCRSYYCFDDEVPSIMMRKPPGGRYQPYPIDSAVSEQFARDRLQYLRARVDEIAASPSGTFKRGYWLAFYEPLIGDLERAIEDLEYWQHMRAEAAA